MTSKLKKQAIPSLSGSQTTEQLLHELQVHQIELEIQNEELRRTEAELKVSQAHYFNLFDLAPVGYILLNEKGLILEANLTVAAKLGGAKNALVNQPLTRFILPEDQDIYEHHRNQLLETGTPQVCELRMLRPDAHPFWACLEATIAQDADGAPVYRAVLSEINQRKQAEEALCESEERYRRLVETLPDGVVVHSQGRIVFANPASATILGAASPVDLTRKPVIEFVHPDYRELALKRIQRSQSEGVPSPLAEEKFVRLDGTPIDVEVSAIPFSYSGKTAMLTVFNDITERKQREEHMTRLNMAMDKSGEAIFMTEREGVFTFVNPEFTHLYGYTADDVVGKTTPRILKSGLRKPEDYALLWQTILNRQVMKGELINKTKDGRLLTIESSINPILDEQGEIVGFLGIQRDITERKRIEEKLEEERILLRTLIDNLPDRIYVKDVQGRKIISNIADWRASGGKTMEDVIGKTDFDTYPLELAKEFWAVDMQVIDSGISIINFEEPGLDSQGNPVWVLSSKVPLRDGQGKIAGLVGIGRDITDRKEAEELQDAIYRIAQAADKAESLDSLYPSIRAIIQEVMVADNFYFALYDEKNDLLNFPYFIDQYNEPPPAPTQIQGLTGYVIRSGRPLLATREIFDRLVQQGEVEAVGTKGEDWLGVPLKVEGRLIGVMAVRSYTQEIHIDQEDMNFLEFVSTQVAQAIERKRLVEEIRSLSLTDELTGLYNRRGFTLLAEEEVKLALRMKRAMLLLFGDVDNLKTINDTWGHAQGDLALKELSAILKGCFRESDILARIGGDEFVVLAVDASKESAESMANRIQVALEARNHPGGETYHLALSLGIARYDPEAPCTVSELIAQADGLMYDQKQARKGKK